nr:hypothetical protein [Sicyoidochytrium minutum DNA virus]
MEEDEAVMLHFIMKDLDECRAAGNELPCDEHTMETFFNCFLWRRDSFFIETMRGTKFEGTAERARAHYLTTFGKEADEATLSKWLASCFYEHMKRLSSLKEA